MNEIKMEATHVEILEILNSWEKPSSIADKRGVPRTNVSAYLRDLKEWGYVELRHDVNDKRVRWYRRTFEGEMYLSGGNDHGRTRTA